ncbi:dihydrofolate reductase family protein [Naumannella cuiyingiana]|uniref:Dihydrofolate reductase n=1 Tax=Naumannella cuiyingiana TaxID=1347891 RepID=A0A7Z0D8I4_9ACTN|nr:dihydrofolate reductase family protein [Naumannella cuiyingiana]NYI70916.1 dihydrofolate reductase [Naumannella cuiyingiana]
MIMATIYYTATTLDGYLADDEDSLDWLFVQEHDDAGAFGYPAFIERVGAIVMGGTTYRWVLDHLARSGGAWEYTQPTWVFTTRPGGVPDGADIRYATGDVAPVHAQMITAAGDRDVWIVGGGDLAGQFADAGLLDEIIVSIAPVTLGSGRPLLPRRLDLRTVEVARNGAFAAVRYAVER